MVFLNFPFSRISNLPFSSSTVFWLAPLFASFKVIISACNYMFIRMCDYLISVGVVCAAYQIFLSLDLCTCLCPLLELLSFFLYFFIYFFGTLFFKRLVYFKCLDYCHPLCLGYSTQPINIFWIKERNRDRWDTGLFRLIFILISSRSFFPTVEIC